MPSFLNYYYHFACRHVNNKCWKLQHNRFNTFRVIRFLSSLVAKNALFEKKVPEDQRVKIVPIAQFHTDISTQNDSICYRGNKNSHFLMGFFDCSSASGMSSSELLENWSGSTLYHIKFLPLTFSPHMPSVVIPIFFLTQSSLMLGWLLLCTVDPFLVFSCPSALRMFGELFFSSLFVSLIKCLWVFIPGRWLAYGIWHMACGMWHMACGGMFRISQIMAMASRSTPFHKQNKPGDDLCLMHFGISICQHN